MACLTNVITSRSILHELFTPMTPALLYRNIFPSHLKLHRLKFIKEFNSIIMQLSKKTYYLSSFYVIYSSWGRYCHKKDLSQSRSSISLAITKTFILIISYLNVLCLN